MCFTKTVTCTCNIYVCFVQSPPTKSRKRASPAKKAGETQATDVDYLSLGVTKGGATEQPSAKRQGATSTASSVDYSRVVGGHRVKAKAGFGFHFYEAEGYEARFTVQETTVDSVSKLRQSTTRRERARGSSTSGAPSARQRCPWAWHTTIGGSVCGLPAGIPEHLG